MSEADDDTSFEQEIKNVREGDDATQQSNSSEKQPENDIEARMKQLDREAKRSERTPLYAKLSDQEKWAVGGISFVIAGSVGLVFYPNPVLPFIIFGLLGAFVAWLGISKIGVAFWKGLAEDVQEASNQSQTQGVSFGENPSKNVVCQNCGWKNPERNNYCHDCGTALSEVDG